MKLFTNLWFLYFIWQHTYALQSSHSQQGQQDIIQQQIYLLQQQLQQLQHSKDVGQVDVATNFDIILPKTIIDDFEYIPTVQGYKFSYRLPNGSIREENAFITDTHMGDYSHMDSRITDFTAIGIGGRPKIAVKNRKLSPGSLKALSG